MNAMQNLDATNAIDSATSTTRTTSGIQLRAAMVHPLSRPELVSVIRAVLVRHGVKQQDLRDAVAEVQTRALEADRADRARGGAERAATIEAWKPLCAAIAAKLGTDGLRRKKTRAKYDAGLCEDPDEHKPLDGRERERHPIDQKRYLGVLQDLFDEGKMPEHGLEILDAESVETPQKEVADELGISNNTLRSRLRRMRDQFHLRIATLGMTLFVSLLMILCAAPLGLVAVLNAPPLDGPAPPSAPAATAVTFHPPAAAPTASPQERAAELRQQGLHACDTRDWDTCLDRLAEAAQLDPDGDTPAVRRVRERASTAILLRMRELEAKP